MSLLLFHPGKKYKIKFAREKRKLVNIWIIEGHKINKIKFQ